MCRYCRHPELRTIRDGLKIIFPAPKTWKERKHLRRILPPLIRFLKSWAAYNRRQGLPTHIVDYQVRALRFAAFIVQDSKWDNGGNLIL